MKVKRTFLEDVRQKNGLVLTLLIVQTIYDFIHNQLVSKSMPNSYQQFYKGTKMIEFHHLIKPAVGDRYSIGFFWFFVNSFGFAVLPIFLWFTTKVLFREKVKKKNQYHFHLFEMNSKRHIVIDYSKWKSTVFLPFNWLFKFVYINTMDIHAMTIMTTIILGWKTLYIFVFLLTICINGYEHFKLDSTEASKASRRPYMRKILKTYIVSYWIMLSLYHVVDLLGRFGFFRDYSLNSAVFMSQYDGGLLLVCLITLTGTFEDFMHSEDYFNISEQFKQESELKIKFACLSKSYDINEKKLYSRTVEMVRKKVIDGLSSSLLERKDITKVPIDTSYMSKDII